MNNHITRKVVEKMLPHAGSMRLIDSVTCWTADSIECHGSCNCLDHPLSQNGKLSSTVAIEYAAQATAVHGFLLANDNVAKFGVLAKLTDISLHMAVVDNIQSPLRIFAQLVARTDQGCIYNFEVNGTRLPIASGRLMIAFPALAEQ